MAVRLGRRQRLLCDGSARHSSARNNSRSRMKSPIKRLASILREADGGWLVVAPDGRYDAGGTGAMLAAWRVGDRLESITSVPSSVRVPHLLAEILRGK